MAKVFTITEGLENMGALRSGGQGSVYKGKRVGEIITAVKLLPTPIHSEDINDKNYRSFQSEVEKLRKVNEEPNPNVVKIYNYGITESGSLPFIEMEFIEGPELEELIKPPHDPVFTIREVIKVADQLSNAIAHCHKCGIKHGDIKSNNVKYNVHTGNYMLLDFGMAIISDEQRRTSMRQAGAIEFMAPEQNEGEVLFQTDVYSFGVLLFELLAGQVPFPLNDNSETSRNNIMVAHMEASLPDILELRKKNLPLNWTEEQRANEMLVPEWLSTLIRKCLEKRPEDRFGDGIELHKTIIRHSISQNSNSAQDAVAMALLKAENERLKHQLEDEQQKIRSMISSSGAAQNKTASKGNSILSGNYGKVAVFLVGLLILASLFKFGNSSAASSNIDTAALHAEKKLLRDSLNFLKSKNIQDSLEADREIALAKQESKALAARYSEAAKEKEHGRKKFKLKDLFKRRQD